VVRFYEKVFEEYQNKAYASVIADVNSALVKFEEDPLVPKFKYIKALAVGSVSGKEEMKVEFDSLIAQHPDTEESLQAKEIIDYMYVEFPEIKEADEAKEAEVIYTEYDPEQEHYFLLALHSSQNVNQVSFDLLNFNLDNFNQYDLKIEQVELTDNYRIIMVKPFTHSEGALRYMQVVVENSIQVMGQIPSDMYRMMIISAGNFETLKQQKIHNPYYLFYQKHYLE